jgi:hypothetical protein
VARYERVITFFCVSNFGLSYFVETFEVQLHWFCDTGGSSSQACTGEYFIVGPASSVDLGTTHIVDEKVVGGRTNDVASKCFT